MGGVREKDERRYDELVAHLLRHVPELQGYSVLPGWKDKPDRVLAHHRLPPIGIEITELLAGSPRGRTDLRVARYWDSVARALSAHPAFNDLSLALHARPERLRSQMDIEQLTDELVRLLLRFRTPDHDLVPPGGWFDEALCKAVQTKSSLLEAYQANMLAQGLVNDRPAVSLLTWTRNEIPGGWPVVEPHPLPPDVTELVAGSGFSAVYYINGIRNDKSGTLHEPFILYPAPTQEGDHVRFRWL